MLQILECGILFIILLLDFLAYGYSVGSRLGCKHLSLPMQVLVGFFAYFIEMQILILPIVFLGGTLKTASILWLIVTLGSLLIMVLLDKNGWHNRMFRLSKLSHNKLEHLTALSVLLVMVLAMFSRYVGWDITYYIGEVNEFLYYGTFWTHDAMKGGIEVSSISFHYALSCFYPLWAILCNLFHIEARILMLYLVRALAVFLSACVAYTAGDIIFKEESHKKACLLTMVYMLLSLLAMASHSSAAMMILRGYESKGYLAAVIGPMCALCLYMVFHYMGEGPVEGHKIMSSPQLSASWKLLGLVAWASMPIAMSSMGVIPAGIAITMLAAMVYYRTILPILWRTVLVLLPNLCYMGLYIARYHLYRFN